MGLGADSTGLFIDPLAINMKGDIALSNQTTHVSTLRTVGGALTTFESTSPSNSLIALSLNDNDVAAGAQSNPPEPAIWSAGAITSLRLPSSVDASSTMATAINNKGQIVGALFGTSSTTGIFWSSPSTTGVVLSPPGLQPLAIDNSGRMVGVVIEGNTYEWYSLDLSTGTAANDLHLSWSDPKGLGVAGFRPAGIAINDSGTIACSTGADSTVVEISPSGAQTTILTHAVVYGMNGRGDVIGDTVSTTPISFIYNPSKGMVDLNSLLPKNSGWV